MNRPTPRASIGSLFERLDIVWLSLLREHVFIVEGNF